MLYSFNLDYAGHPVKYVTQICHDVLWVKISRKFPINIAPKSFVFRLMSVFARVFKWVERLGST